MQMFYYLKAWFGYMDLTLSDIFIFSVLCMLIVLGVYTMMKKDFVLGISQILLSFFTPYLVLMFISAHKDFMGIEMKTWIRLLSSNSVEGPGSIALLVLILVPVWMIVTTRTLYLLKNRK